MCRPEKINRFTRWINIRLLDCTVKAGRTDSASLVSRRIYKKRIVLATIPKREADLRISAEKVSHRENISIKYQ